MVVGAMCRGSFAPRASMLLKWLTCFCFVTIVESIEFPTNAMSRSEDITSFFVQFCQQHNLKKILDVGPGRFDQMFPLATHTVDYRIMEVNQSSNVLRLVHDFDQDKLPFPDKYFDFVYSRHVLEVITSISFYNISID
jgi:hypothetical protein